MTHLRAATFWACHRFLVALFPIAVDESCQLAWLKRAEPHIWRGGGL